MSSGAANWVKLNVGGKLFQTTLTTLLSSPDSLLAKMFDPESGLEPAYSENGVFFLDSNPKYFSVILDWLRYKKVMADSDINLDSVADVADFFGIEELVYELKFKGSIIILSDESEATEYRGNRMGLYLKEAETIYRQAGGEKYLFRAPSGVWHINAEFNEDGNNLRNTTSMESSRVPRRGWEFFDVETREWIQDDDIKVIDAPEFKFCNSITISSTKCPRKEFLGEFRRVPNDWYCGWPVFKNKEGNLLGVFNKSFWSVGNGKDENCDQVISSKPGH